MKKEDYMLRCLEIAKNGLGKTNPNPMVGCIVVKRGRIIGEGFHAAFGGPHAERAALGNCSEDPAGADLYVNLEPCCHQGKTPPCTDIIIEKKIARVYVGTFDPNPKVAGKGAEILRENGIEVEVGILEKECKKFNEVFFHYITTKNPFVTMKWAMTLDGKIACVTGSSRWVSCEESRRHTHGLRNQNMAIMVGIGSVLADDPLLNCRIPGGADPLRVICDSSLRIPMDSQIVKTAQEIPTIIACVGSRLTFVEKGKILKLASSGIEVISTNEANGVNLRELMKILGERGIDSVLIDGGGELNGSALESGIVNKVYAYIAPKMVGGKGAPSPVKGIGVQEMDQAFKLREVEVSTLGTDLLVSGYLK